MKPFIYDFTQVIKILKLRKERHELFYSNKSNNARRQRQISEELFKLTGNEIYLRF
jgi:hypothetical protein